MQGLVVSFDSSDRFNNPIEPVEGMKYVILGFDIGKLFPTEALLENRKAAPWVVWFVFFRNSPEVIEKKAVIL